MIIQICFGATIIAFWLNRAPVAYAILFVAGIFMMILFAMIMSLVQLTVQEEMRGSVMSIYMVAFRGGVPTGGLVTGLLPKGFPLPSMMLVEGAMLSLIALTFFFRDPK